MYVKLRKNVVFDSHSDHRMAMSLAPLALKFKNITINNPEVVSKSYPDFWSDLRLAKFQLRGSEIL